METEKIGSILVDLSDIDYHIDGQIVNFGLYYAQIVIVEGITRSRSYHPLRFPIDIDDIPVFDILEYEYYNDEETDYLTEQAWIEYTDAVSIRGMDFIYETIRLVNKYIGNKLNGHHGLLRQLETHSDGKPFDELFIGRFNKYEIEYTFEVYIDI